MQCSATPSCYPNGVCSVLAARPPFKREACIRGKGGNGRGSGEISCHDIYPARPITTVSLAANTYCMMDGVSSRAPRAVGSIVQCGGPCE